jgi:hypothetical protein
MAVLYVRDQSCHVSMQEAGSAAVQGIMCYHHITDNNRCWLGNCLIQSAVMQGRQQPTSRAAIHAVARAGDTLACCRRV